MSLVVLRAAAWAAALLLLPPLAAAAPLSLDDALALAAGRSLTAQAAEAGALSAREAAQAAAQLPDPMLSLGLENLPATGEERFRSSAEPMTMKRIAIRQTWLSAEKRGARQAAADAAVERQSVQARVADAETRLNTALAYVDAFYAGETLRLAMLAEAHAREELQIARARLASAAGSGAEALALAAAQGLSEDEAAEIRQQQSAARIALQRWIGVAPEALQPPAALPLPGEPGYVARHPQVAALRRDAELAARQADVTASERRPDWSWELAYGQRVGRADMVSLGVSIPLYVAPAQRQDRNTAASRALAAKAEAELAEAERAAGAEYRALQSDAERLDQRIARYRAEVLTVAGQRTAAALAADRAGQAGLVALFEARHAELGAERRLLALQRERARTHVQLAFRPLQAEVAP